MKDQRALKMEKKEAEVARYLSAVQRCKSKLSQSSVLPASGVTLRVQGTAGLHSHAEAGAGLDTLSLVGDVGRRVRDEDQKILELRHEQWP